MASRFFSRTLSASNTLHEAAELGNIDKLQQFVNAGKEMGYPARETLRTRDALVGATCLHYAAEHGRTKCAKVTSELYLSRQLASPIETEPPGIAVVTRSRC